MLPEGACVCVSVCVCVCLCVCVCGCVCVCVCVCYCQDGTHYLINSCQVLIAELAPSSEVLSYTHLATSQSELQGYLARLLC